MNPRQFLIHLVPIFLLSGCTQAARQARDEYETPRNVPPAVVVREVIDAMTAANRAGDVEGLLSHFAEYALVMPPNTGPFTGVGTLRQRYLRLSGDSSLEVTVTSRETEVVGDWAFDRGTAEGRVIPKDENLIPDRFNYKYLMVLRRHEDGLWKVTHLIWNSSDPSLL